MTGTSMVSGYQAFLLFGTYYLDTYGLIRMVLIIALEQPYRGYCFGQRSQQHW